MKGVSELRADSIFGYNRKLRKWYSVGHKGVWPREDWVLKRLLDLTDCGKVPKWKESLTLRSRATYHARYPI
jgi:hypothetical protein